MPGQGIKKTIIDDIKNLSISRQKKLHDYARAMLVSKPVGSLGKELARFSGMLDKKTAMEMKKAIQEACEQEVVGIKVLQWKT